MSKMKTSYGPEAYRLKQETRGSWLSVADKMGYEPSKNELLRSQAVCSYARDFAKRNNKPWPIDSERPRNAGKRAYYLKAKDKDWDEIMEELNYRPKWHKKARRHAIYRLAQGWASRNGMPWPPEKH